MLQLLIQGWSFQGLLPVYFYQVIALQDCFVISRAITIHGHDEYFWRYKWILMLNWGLTEMGTAIISATRRSSRNQVRRGGGREPNTRQLRATSLPAERGFSVPISLTFSGGTNSISWNQVTLLIHFSVRNVQLLCGMWSRYSEDWLPPFLYVTRKLTYISCIWAGGGWHAGSTIVFLKKTYS